MFIYISATVKSGQCFAPAYNYITDITQDQAKNEIITGQLQFYT